MKKIVVSKEEQSIFDREMENFLGGGSVKMKTSSSNYEQLNQSNKNSDISEAARLGGGSLSGARTRSMAFKMMQKGKDGKQLKFDISLPETASFAVEAKKRQIIEAKELSEVRRVTLQRTADMQEEAIQSENNQHGSGDATKRKNFHKKGGFRAGDPNKERDWTNVHRKL